MPKTKATMTLADGTQVIIEGNPTEVAAIVNQLGFKSEKSGATRRVNVSVPTGRRSAKDKKIKSSPTDLILSLADGGFFKKPQGLVSIKEGLAEIGHIYPVQTLSSILFKMVRRRYLRRVKQEGRWVYVR